MLEGKSDAEGACLLFSFSLFQYTLQHIHLNCWQSLRTIFIFLGCSQLYERSKYLGCWRYPKLCPTQSGSHLFVFWIPRSRLLCLIKGVEHILIPINLLPAGLARSWGETSEILRLGLRQLRRDILPHRSFCSIAVTELSYKCFAMPLLP